MKKFWKKNTDVSIETPPDITEVAASTLYRWFLYDSQIPNPNKVAAALGFSPISDELEEMEIRDSIARLKEVLPYKMFIELMAMMNGKALAEGMSDVLKEHNLIPDDVQIGEEELQMMETIYTKVSYNVLIPAFAAALALGIVINPGMATGARYVK